MEVREYIIRYSTIANGGESDHVVIAGMTSTDILKAFKVVSTPPIVPDSANGEGKIDLV